MKYRDAKKLHNEDEVVRKSDGAFLRVISVEDDPGTKAAVVTCDDGNGYLHTELK